MIDNIIKFPEKTFFCIEGEIYQTDDKGRIDYRDFTTFIKLTSESATTSLKLLVYRFLEKHKMLVYDTTVRAVGNSARIPIPVEHLNKKVKVWVGFI